MTREEAIKKINAIKKYLTAGNPMWDVKEIDEVLNMAIEAIQKRDIIVTQFINELGVTIETNTNMSATGLK